MVTSDRRAQAHTLEAFIAAILLIGALLFAMQATAVTPLSASTSNQHIENQQRALAGDLLSVGIEDGSLSETVRYWDPDEGAFEASPEVGYYTSSGSETAFLDSLNRALSEQRIAYNVYVRYHRADSQTSTPSMRTDRLVYMGQPSDNAVTASRTVTLYGDDELTGSDSSRLDDLEPGAFYAPNVGDGLVYNRLEVRIVTWRM